MKPKIKHDGQNKKTKTHTTARDTTLKYTE